MEETIREIVAQEFKTRETLIRKITDKGLNNLVFYIEKEKEPFILRMKKSLPELETYQKEKWCSDLAKNAGIPTPTILKMGICGEYSFSFQEYIGGVDGNDVEDKAHIWYTLGQYSKIINSIPAKDFALDYKSYIQKIFDGDFFVTNDIFSQEISSGIKERLEETTRWKFQPSLCHRNLNPSNVVLNKEGVVHLIDWENAAGDYAPLSELGEIYTWDTGKENILQFLSGYGLKELEVQLLMRDIQTSVLLRLAGMVHRKVTESNIWHQDSFIHDTIKVITEIKNYQEDVLFTKNL